MARAGKADGGLLKFITCGSVDDGKSTLIGHILYDSKLLYADQEQALLLDSKVGSRGGEIDYALLLDGLMAEREQGITIDVAYRYFTTDVRSFIVADTPGHEEYTRNMAVGASFADLAVILVDASAGVQIQTRRHMRICALMGIRYFVFAVNKMDMVGYDEGVFRRIEEGILRLKDAEGMKNVLIIPVSATEGDNVTKPSGNMPWYGGGTLLHFLETVDVSADEAEAGFFMPVQRVCRPNHAFRGFQGQIESGRIAVGELVTSLPGGETAFVKSIRVADAEADHAFKGQPVTIQLDREVDVSRGCVLEKGAGLKVAKEFAATLLWMDDAPLAPGKDYWAKVGTKLLPAIVTGIRYRLDVNTGARLDAETVGKNEIVQCEIVLTQPAVLDEFRLHKTLGELILIDRVSHATAACGVVESIGGSAGDGTVFADGAQEMPVRMFDRFYYHQDIDTVLRHSPSPERYAPGDRLPLQEDGFRYPPDFDLSSGGLVANIRGGAFRGFGARDARVPLLDKNGIDAEGARARDFTKYRKIAVWEPEYEI
ncbi:MAG: sulfate adenylyltransferase [Clostridiales Family XIII bacterium]|jgi:sulfate adenylyltransferase subunit 1|nr:sulfate adenylyltransferase [Clostridiales Family XIII bacterium]